MVFRVGAKLGCFSAERIDVSLSFGAWRGGDPARDEFESGAFTGGAAGEELGGAMG